MKLSLRFACVGVLGGLLICARAPRPADELVGLLGSLRSGEQNPALLAQRAHELGPRAAGTIFLLLSNGQPGAGELAVLGPDERSFLDAALASWPPKEAVDAILERVPEAATLEQRLVAVRLIGTVGDAETVASVFDLLAPLPGPELQHPLVQEEATRALAAILARDPIAYGTLAPRIRKENVFLLEVLARAIGDAGSGLGLPLLEQMLRRSRALEQDVLEALGRLDPWAPELASGSAATTLDYYLGSADPKLRREAAVALGRLREREKLGSLLRLLDDPDARVRRSALESMQALSGLRWPADVERWSRWLASEQRWRELELQKLAALVQADDVSSSLNALRQIGFHPLHGREASSALEPALRHTDERVATATCRTLGRLADPSALSALIGALEDGRALVRASAHQGLQRITGEELPAEAGAWRALLEG